MNLGSRHNVPASVDTDASCATRLLRNLDLSRGGSLSALPCSHHELHSCTLRRKHNALHGLGICACGYAILSLVSLTRILLLLDIPPVYGVYASSSEFEFGRGSMADLLSLHATETFALLNEASSCDVPSDTASPTVTALQATGGEQLQRRAGRGRSSCQRTCACLPHLARGRWVSIGVFSVAFLVMLAVAGILEMYAVDRERFARRWCYSQYTGVILLCLLLSMVTKRRDGRPVDTSRN